MTNAVEEVQQNSDQKTSAEASKEMRSNPLYGMYAIDDDSIIISLALNNSASG